MEVSKAAHDATSGVQIALLGTLNFFYICYADLKGEAVVILKVLQKPNLQQPKGNKSARCGYGKAFPTTQT